MDSIDVLGIVPWDSSPSNHHHHLEFHTLPDTNIAPENSGFQ